MDPYEAQLYAVYKIYADSSGNLDFGALTKLCVALQMEKNSTDELLSISKRSGQRITFSRFKDSLVKVLGGTGDSSVATHAGVISHSDEESGCEQSPKFVYGAKKYGRRSKPRDIPGKTKNPNETSAVTNTSSNSETSQRSLAKEFDLISSNPQMSNCIENKQIHSELELDHSKVINSDEAIALCQSMRMENIDIELIKDIFNEGDVRLNRQLTVGEFFHQLNKKLITSITVEKDKVPISYSNTGTGWDSCNLMEREHIVEMWEKAGILHCRQMLHDLGFTGNTINISELAMCLDDEIKSLLGDANKTSGINVPSLLLQASLCLHRHELRCIRDVMDQVFAENSKMKTDLQEANQRAQMLAQEVDENHAKMESSLKIKIKQLETKTLEMSRIADEERRKEHEVLNAEMCKLREKLTALEGEESKLRTHCATLEQTNEELERRLSRSEELNGELDQIRMHLTREIKLLKSENEHNSPNREQTSEIEKLTTLVSDCQLENKSLRDRNDELSIEIENLQHKLTRENRRLSLGRSKPQCSVDITSEQAMSLLEEWEGGLDSRRDGPNATKRRGDSPSKGTFSLHDDESPRIGKLRRCVGDLENEDSSRAEWEQDSYSDSTSPFLHQSLQIEADKMEEILLDNKLPLDSYSNFINLIQRALNISNENNLTCESCDTLKGILLKIHKNQDKIEVTDNDKTESSNSKATETSTQTEDIELVKHVEEKNKELENEVKKLKEEKDKLASMCRDFEVSLEQLKSEYDKCEEYWASKLDEEREIYSEEQRISDEKFQDLLSKISEYEEQFAPSQNNKSKLDTIDERYSLETQFTDLEEEFELYKQKISLELEEKVKEIDELKEQVKELGKKANSQKKIESAKTCSSNLDEVDSAQKTPSPIDYLWNQSTIQQPIQKNGERKRDCARDYQNPAYKSSSEENTTEKFISSSDVDKEPAAMNPIKKPPVPDKGSNQSAGAYSERGWAEYQQVSGGMIHCAELEGQLRKNAQPSQSERSWTESGVCILEQRCRQLQLSLTQHQMVLQAVQQNARSENMMLRQRLESAEAAVSMLQQRLTNADLLVKDLYVENCQLTAFKPHPL